MKNMFAGGGELAPTEAAVCLRARKVGAALRHAKSCSIVPAPPATFSSNTISLGQARRRARRLQHAMFTGFIPSASGEAEWIDADTFAQTMEEGIACAARGINTPPDPLAIVPEGPVPRKRCRRKTGGRVDYKHDLAPERRLHPCNAMHAQDERAQREHQPQRLGKPQRMRR